MKESHDPRLLKGIEEFNQGLYFECHETLEEIWLEDNSEDRKFYQGLIQVAAGYLKWEQGVLMGAIKLWRSGLEKIEPYPRVHLGVDLDVVAEQEHVQAAPERAHRLELRVRAGHRDRHEVGVRHLPQRGVERARPDAARGLARALTLVQQRGRLRQRGLGRGVGPGVDGQSQPRHRRAARQPSRVGL